MKLLLSLSTKERPQISPSLYSFVYNPAMYCSWVKERLLLFPPSTKRSKWGHKQAYIDRSVRCMGNTLFSFSIIPSERSQIKSLLENLFLVVKFVCTTRCSIILARSFLLTFIRIMLIRQDFIEIMKYMVNHLFFRSEAIWLHFIPLVA